VNQLNQNDGAQINANSKRIVNVGMCSSLYDGVPKIYVDNRIDELDLSGTSNNGQFTIVFTNDSPSDGYISAPYTVGRDRQGQIEDCWLTLGSAPTGTATCSVNFILDGTHTLLETALTLHSGSCFNGGKGPTHVGLSTGTCTQFASYGTASIPAFIFNTTAQLQIITSGGASLLAAGLVIRRV
jgi:hypothetical protein